MENAIEIRKQNSNEQICKNKEFGIGTVVYIDGIKCHLGRIGNRVVKDGETWCVMQSVLIDGEYVEYDGNEDVVDWMYTIDCLSEADEEHVRMFEKHEQENEDNEEWEDEQ